jgi:hypothetical protein
MASDFYDLRPEQVPNAVTQSFPNVHFLAKSSTVSYLVPQNDRAKAYQPCTIRRSFLSVAALHGLPAFAFSTMAAFSTAPLTFVTGNAKKLEEVWPMNLL